MPLISQITPIKCVETWKFLQILLASLSTLRLENKQSGLYFLSLIRNSARAVCGVTSLSDSDDATEFDLNQVIEVRKHWQKNRDSCVVQLRCDSTPKHIYQNMKLYCKIYNQYSI